MLIVSPCCPDSQFLWDRGLLSLRYSKGTVAYSIKAGPIEILVSTGCPFCNHKPVSSQNHSINPSKLEHQETIKNIIKILDICVEMGMKGSFNINIKPNENDPVEKLILDKLKKILPDVTSKFEFNIFELGDINGKKESF